MLFSEDNWYCSTAFCLSSLYFEWAHRFFESLPRIAFTSYLELRKTFRDLVKCKMLVMLISKNRHLIALSKRTRERFCGFTDLAPNLKVGKPNNSALSVLFSIHAHIPSSFLSSCLATFCSFISLLIKKFKVPEGYWFVIESFACSFVMTVMPGHQSTPSINPCLPSLSSFWGKLCRRSLETLLMRMFIKTLKIG